MGKNIIDPETEKDKQPFETLIVGMYRENNHVTHLSGWRFLASEQFSGYVQVTATPPGYNLHEGAMVEVLGKARQHVIDLLSAPAPTRPPNDPAAVIVAKLLAGEYSEKFAVYQINALIRKAVKGALVETLPNLTFHTDEEIE